MSDHELGVHEIPPDRLDKDGMVLDDIRICSYCKTQRWQGGRLTIHSAATDSNMSGILHSITFCSVCINRLDVEEWLFNLYGRKPDEQ
jgi:hypothetical protein